jgi:hypothetical protein
MSYMPAFDPVAHADWPDLVAEFDRWREAGRIAPLWWRDDDAMTATPQLAALLRLAEGIPLAVAAIPALARAELAGALHGAPLVAILQHGWQHRNHATSGKKSEYPPYRPAGQIAAEIAAGRARLASLFGARALPVFVPPWNRLAAEFAPLLAGTGMLGLSAMAPRRWPAPAGVMAVDVHVDLVAWQSGRGFVGEPAALGGLVGGLRAMREGALAAPALGMLTHHAIIDRESAAFLARLAAAIAAHPAARWANLTEFLP